VTPATGTQTILLSTTAAPVAAAPAAPAVVPVTTATLLTGAVLGSIQTRTVETKKSVPSETKNTSSTVIPAPTISKDVMNKDSGSGMGAGAVAGAGALGAGAVAADPSVATDAYEDYQSGDEVVGDDGEGGSEIGEWDENDEVLDEGSEIGEWNEGDEVLEDGDGDEGGDVVSEDDVNVVDGDDGNESPGEEDDDADVDVDDY
jgi:hypothetical protein